MIYFNWYELLIKSKKDYNSILILTYALSVGYNKKISSSAIKIAYDLHISHVPLDVLRYFYERKFNLFSKVKTEEPQSYFKNSSFLKTKHKLVHKISYLKLLSYRRIDDQSSFIYKDILTDKQLRFIEKNPFVKVGDKKIYFIGEFT